MLRSLASLRNFAYAQLSWINFFVQALTGLEHVAIRILYMEQDRNPKISGVAARISQEQFFEQMRSLKDQEAQEHLFSEYWNRCLTYFRENNHFFPIVQPQGTNCVTLLYSLRQCQISFGCFWYAPVPDPPRGIGVYVILSYYFTGVYENLWYPRHEEIEEQTGLAIEWNKGERQASLSIRQYGADHRNRDEWPDHYKWYATTLDTLLPALMGDIPFSDWVILQSPAEQRELLREQGIELEKTAREQGLHKKC